ncbi:hypothetical protein AGR5A_Cc90065 [Agrobacterium genomosp. 5 str. CFBP 6626]|nr:hypothetical protein AGR5A_Cc90065 [Agrobacterium genomosp. 5 str. CFBP 6626]
MLDGRLQEIQGDEAFAGLTLSACLWRPGGLAPADVNHETRRSLPHGGPNVPVRYAFKKDDDADRRDGFARPRRGACGAGIPFRQWSTSEGTLSRWF